MVGALTRWFLVLAVLAAPAAIAHAQDGELSLDEKLLQLAEESEGEVIELEGEAPETAEPPAYELSPETVRSVPGAGNDVLRAVQSLPGTARMPFGIGGLVLRGSSPRDTSVYLDGIRVPILYHFGGLSSFYPAGMLADLTVTPGGFGAAYGRSQGGLVTLESRAGREDRWRFASEVGLIDAQARGDGPVAGGSLSVGVRRSYVDAVLAVAVPDDSDVQLTLAPRYYDAQARYDTRLAGGQLTATVFGSDDRVQILSADDPGDPDRFEFQQSFVRAGLRWRKRVGAVDYDVAPWIGIDENAIRVGEDFVTRDQIPFGTRAGAVAITGWGLVSGGVDLRGARVTYDSLGEAPPMPEMPPSDDDIRLEKTMWYADLGFYTDVLYRITDRFAVRPGVRVDRLGLSGEWVLDPRLGLTQEAGGFRFEQTLGVYHQPPVAADVDPVSGNPDLESSYSVQATARASRRLPGGVDASVTGFYEDMRDLPVDVVSSATAAVDGRLSGGVASVSFEATSETWGTYSYQENRGRGRNYGAELMVRRDGPRWSGWLAYTASRAERRDDPRMSTAYRRFVLDQPHVLTALGSVELGAWRLGSRVRFASGNPITPVAGTYFDADEQRYQPIDGGVLSARLPYFFQLDARVDRTWVRDWGKVALFLDVQNLTNRVNPEGVSYNFDYTERTYTRGLPIFPSIGVELTQ